MADYFYINNYTSRGKLAISHDVFDEIITIVTNKIQGVSVSKKRKKNLFSFHKPVHCEIKNGKVTSIIEIKVAKDIDVDQIIKTIQEEVVQAISDMTELVPFTPVIKVVGFDESI